MSTITLVLHMEDGSWWADSPDLPGFSAADSDLQELRVTARMALRDILGDRGEDMSSLEIREELADPGSASDGDIVTEASEFSGTRKTTFVA